MNEAEQTELTPRDMPPDAVIERFALTIAPMLRMFNWHWAHKDKCAVPSVSRITETIRGMCAAVANRECECTRAGGLIVEWDEDYSRIAMSFVLHIDAEYD